MIKKRAAFALLIGLVILSSFSLILAESTDDKKIEQAYTCLKNSVSPQCNGDTEETAFSLMALAYNETYQINCRNSLLSLQNPEGCWGVDKGASCDLKSTAIAILALKTIGTNVDKPIEWLLKQKKASQNLNWFLEIDNTGINTQMKCQVAIGENYDTFNFSEDKKISSFTDPLNCFSKSTSPFTDYFINIAPQCYDQEFTIWCDKNYINTLFYLKDNIIHLSGQSETRDAEDSITRQIESFCLTEQGECSYEGSLWSAFALAYGGGNRDDVDNLLPYLESNKEDNNEFLPSSFLYRITGVKDFYIDLLSYPYTTSANRANPSAHWEATNNQNEFYNTGIGLLGLLRESGFDKTPVKKYLLEGQDSNGCWNNNERDTALILYTGFNRDPASLGSPYWTCGDSDGGINSTVFGNVIVDISDKSQPPIEVLDTCLNETDLSEAYCGNDNKNATKIISCDNGCEDGKCKSESTIVNECNTTGEKKCFNNYIKECGDYNNDTYLEWKVIDTCPNGCEGTNGTARCKGGGRTVQDNCEDNNGYCVGMDNQCSAENDLSEYNYKCDNFDEVCCRVPYTPPTCAKQGGEVCGTDKECKGITFSASDTTECCKAGCKDIDTKIDEFTCEENNYHCRTLCNSDEEENFDYTCDSEDVCCQEKPKKSSNWILIILLIILIILVVLAIIFREQLKVWFFRMKSKFGSKKGPSPTGRPPMPPPGFMGRAPMIRRPIQTRVPPRQARRPAPRPRTSDAVFDNTMKKLKDMSK